MPAMGKTQNQTAAARSRLLLWHENGFPFVLQKKHHELRGLGQARVAPAQVGNGLICKREFHMHDSHLRTPLRYD